MSKSREMWLQRKGTKVQRCWLCRWKKGAHESRKMWAASGSCFPYKPRRQVFPSSLRKGTHPPAPRCEPSETHVGLRACRTVRQICVVLSHEVLATGYSSDGKLIYHDSLADPERTL